MGRTSRLKLGVIRCLRIVAGIMSLPVFFSFLCFERAAAFSAAALTQRFFGSVASTKCCFASTTARQIFNLPGLRKLKEDDSRVLRFFLIFVPVFGRSSGLSSCSMQFRGVFSQNP